ncbi:MAG: class I SAM-dependent methyltransferase [Balneolaceae bacterium]|nr:class I SAM-dependent methyltransferase [Balneolaceae bacterium]MCH8547743.1 class I SAM-dependent methyltransferase [Balneolaceae bacterium]
MALQIRSPLHERESIDIPDKASELSMPFNGTISSPKGDEYFVKNNVIDLLSGTKEKEYSLAQSTNHWRLTASVYEDLWRKRSLSLLTGEEFPIAKEEELLLEWVQPSNSGSYLDVGCSTALYSRLLKKAAPNSRQVALDFSNAMLLEARLKAEADQTDIFFIRADARDMPFFGQTFDGVVMGGTLNELTDELKVLYECRRVLKSDGVMFMMHLIKSSHWGGRFLQESVGVSGIQFWSVNESNTLFERAGFRVEEQITRGIVCFTKLRPA